MLWRKLTCSFQESNPSRSAYSWSLYPLSHPGFNKFVSRILNCIFINTLLIVENLDSAYGIATGYGLDDRRVGVRVPVGVKNFVFSMWSRPALRSTQPPIQWALGALSPVGKGPKCEADHSSPDSAEVKKIWIYTFIPSYSLMA
jgi:hypothetical protein